MIDMKKSWSKVLTCAALALPAGVAGAHSLVNTQADSSVASTDSTLFWQGFAKTEALSTTVYETIESMADSSDAVVLGRIVSFKAGRMFSADGVDTLMATAEVRVERQLRGTIVQDVFPVEFVIPGKIDSALAQIDQQAMNLPQEDMILFLHAKRGQGEAGLFRLTHDLGLWQESGDQLVTPMGDIEGADELSREHGADEHGEGHASVAEFYKEEIGGIKTLKGLAEFLENN